MLADTFYHIYNHANGNENLFRDDENYNFFLQKWVKYIEPIVDTYAYCLMPNHFHMLVKIKTEEELLRGKNLSGFLSKQLSNFFNSYAKAYNKMYERKGSLFNRPFKAKPVTDENYLTTLICYIHHNPIHHGFTKYFNDWKHCSYLTMLSDNDTFIMRKEVIEWFGNIEELIRFHKQSLQEIEKIEVEFT